ncbi:hypothetical protein LV476_08495 [Guyparkeria hydrothermalis]|uniref:hypothetical protein n=1 Tax=Guyparkeria hydrothermalis TaxID=923 RepID=UPI0020223C28|nr:hypothetical protein [Guyparkeria hydrothermalis]MCL7744974.1 hypothetical protein [Guyparkeria hydrothermalis]
MLDLSRYHWRELRALVDEARAELERREAAPIDEDTALKSLELEFKRHRRKQDEPFDPFA